MKHFIFLLFLIFYVCIFEAFGHHKYGSDAVVHGEEKPSKSDFINDAFYVFSKSKDSSKETNYNGPYQKYGKSDSSSSSSSSSESDEDYTFKTQSPTTPSTTTPTTTTKSCTGCADPSIKQPDPENERWNVAAVLTPAVEGECEILNVKCDFTDQPEPQALKTGYMIFNENGDLTVNPAAAEAIPTTSLTCSAGTYKYNGGAVVNSVGCESSFCDTCEISYGIVNPPDLGQSPQPIITYDNLNGEGCRKGTITCDYKNDNPTSGIMHFGLIGLDGVMIDYVGTTPGPPQTVVKADFVCDSTGYGVYTPPGGPSIEFQFVSCTGNQP